MHFFFIRKYNFQLLFSTVFVEKITAEIKCHVISHKNTWFTNHFWFRAIGNWVIVFLRQTSKWKFDFHFSFWTLWMVNLIIIISISPTSPPLSLVLFLPLTEWRILQQVVIKRWLSANYRNCSDNLRVETFWMQLTSCFNEVSLPVGRPIWRWKKVHVSK